MEHITGIKKYLFLLKGLRKEFFFLPLDFISFMIKQMKYEKFTLHDNKVFINTLYTPFPSLSYGTALKCFIKLSKKKLSPFSAHISVTDRCHLNCWHCSNAIGEPAEDMPFEALAWIIRELQDLGTSCIGFTGGEPGLRKDLEQIISQVDSRSYSILFTTGYSLDDKRAKNLKEAGLTAAVISLDSHIPEEHNRKRNSNRAFDDAIAAINNSLRAGIYTAVSTVMNKEMLYSDKINEFIRFAAHLGVPEIRILEPKPCGKLLRNNFEVFFEEDRARIRNLQYAVNRDRTLPKIMALAHVNSGKNFGCNAGRTHMYINAKGEVFPCDFSPLSFGRFSDESLLSIYQKMAQCFARPSAACVNARIAKYVKDNQIEALPIRGKEAIELLSKGIEQGPVPTLFARLGFREEKNESRI